MQDRYRPDHRRHGDYIHQLGCFSKLNGKRSDGDHWTQSFFEILGNQYSLADETEPSSALLSSIAKVFENLTEEFNELPTKVRQNYFVHRLKVSRLGSKADSTYVAFEGKGPKLPVTIPKKSVLIADESDNPIQREYYLNDSVTVSPIRIAAITSYQRFRDGGELAVAREIDSDRVARPFFPFGARQEITAGTLARKIFIVSKYLEAAKKGTQLTIEFSGVRPNKEQFMEALGSLIWEISTAEGFVLIEDFVIRAAGKGRVRVVMDLSVNANCVPLDPAKEVPEESEQVLDGNLPAIRISRPFHAGSTLALQTEFRAITGMGFEDVSLQFQGGPIRAQDVYTNLVQVKTGAPFACFGETPQVGSTLHVGCGKILALPLQQLKVAFQDVEEQYRAIPTVPLFNKNGEIEGERSGLQWERFAKGAWEPLDTVYLSCANKVQASEVGLLRDFGGEADILGLNPLLDSFSTSSWIHETEGNWLRIRLRQCDFGWSRYQFELEEHAKSLVRIATDKGSIISSALRNLKKKLPWAPKEESRQLVPPSRPMAPKLVDIWLRYSSHPVLLSANTENLKVWRQLGIAGAQPLDATRRGHYLPFKTGGMKWPGILLVGLKGVVPGVPISLFASIQHLQLQALDSNGAFKVEYSTTDGWKLLDVVDMTHGLTESGLIKFFAPENWSSIHRLPVDLQQPTGLFWLRMRASNPSDRVALEGLVANAVEVEYCLTGEDDSLPEQPLAARTSMSLKDSIPGITNAFSLTPSINGHKGDTEREHLHRGEKLVRHRNRMISPWDVEQQILDEFPQISLVRCIPHALDRKRRVPGAFVLMLVPDLQSRFPLIQQKLREEVLDFVRNRSTSSTCVRIQDPLFVDVQISTKVKIKAGLVPHEASQSLQMALQNWLHPKSRFGGHFQFEQPLALSIVKDFLEDLEIVRELEFLTFGGRFSLYSILEPDQEGEILTSASQHEIQVSI